MRRILLWLAQNRWLREHVPRWWFARRAVRRFMPGHELEDALRAGEAFARDGIATLFTQLGENLTTLDEAQAVADHYLHVLDEIRRRGLDTWISVKPTQLGLDLDVAATSAHLDRLAAKAAEVGTQLWLDMESSAYTESTIALYESLRRAHSNVGICLQAYLRRTPADIQRLLPLAPGIRLVKGAYDEPASIAYRTAREVDEQYLAQAVLLLVEGRPHGARLALGTHDVRLVEQVSAYAQAAGISRDTFEVQMLYGIRVDQQRRLAREGYRVRDLVSYGPAWYGWYLRRLAERPANVLFAARQLLPW
jgi:proline dehydrogenase